MQIDIKTCCRYLGTAEDILILCHRSPDGDTLGSGFGLSYALQSIGKRVRVLCSDPLPDKFSNFYPTEPQEEFEPKYIVAVDVADTKLLGVNLAHYADRVDLCIDHHISNTGYAAALLLDAKAAACAEIIYEVISAMGLPLDLRIATALYTGIATDTGCFRYPSTTARTHQVAARLIEAEVDNGAINTALFETKSHGRLNLEKLVMNGLTFYYDNRCALLVLSREMMAQSGAAEEDVDGISALPRQIEGVQVAAVLRESETGSYKVSLRTAAGVNASRICEELGGGGHKAAAGCMVRGPVQEAVDRLLTSIAAELERVAQC